MNGMMSSSHHDASKKHLIIIGGGIAGVTCAQSYTYLRPNDKITIISQSPLLKSVFNVNKISKTLEEFQVRESDVNDVFNSSNNNISIVISTVNKIDTNQHIVYLDTNEKQSISTLSFDYICICSGARPNVIKVDNYDLQKYIIGIRDTETVEDLKKRLVGARRVVIVGNGGIAMELSHEISMCQVIWSIKDNHIGNAFFDNDAASFLYDSRYLNSNKEVNSSSDIDLMIVDRSLNGDDLPMSNRSSIGPQWYSKYKFIGGVDGSKIKSHGSSDNICVEYGTTVVNLVTGDDGYPVCVLLSNGKRYDCDFIVSATGVLTNHNMIATVGSDIKYSHDGYIVNENMMTSATDVFAAGDVADLSQWSDPSPLWFQMKLWSQARTMGRYAAQCIAKHTKLPYTDEISTRFEFEIFAHVTRFFNMKVVMLGLYNNIKDNNNNTPTIYHKVKPGKSYIKLTLNQEGRLVGALLIGETDLEETFENLMMNQIDLSRFGQDILNSDIDIEDYFD